MCEAIEDKAASAEGCGQICNHDVKLLSMERQAGP